MGGKDVTLAPNTNVLLRVSHADKHMYLCFTNQAVNIVVHKKRKVLGIRKLPLVNLKVNLKNTGTHIVILRERSGAAGEIIEESLVQIWR